MNQNSKAKPPCKSGDKSGISCCQESTCQVEALIAVDERGQMVLPKDVRDKASIKAGDKLALISWTREDKVLCFSLMKSEDLGLFVKDYLGPAMAGGGA
jgi:antitoxin PrlF